MDTGVVTTAPTVTVDAEEGWPVKAIREPPLSVTVVEAVAEQPPAPTTVTEYTPVVLTVAVGPLPT